MGDIADMMLEGILCQGCGEFLGDGEGYPMFCSACGGDEESDFQPSHLFAVKQINDAPKVWGCSDCKKMFRKKAYALEHCKATGHREPVDTTKKVTA